MLNGIDVSNHNGAINWTLARTASLYFAGIKATEGLGYQDPTFHYNWNSTRTNGIHRIAYHFLRPDLDGSEQADYFHTFVHANGGLRPGDCVMLDVEVLDAASPSKCVECCEDFVANILHRTECGVYIYTASFFWKDTIGDPTSDLLAMCPLWQASYGAFPGILRNWPNGPSMWQYSASGLIPGIHGDVDLDHFLGDFAAYLTLARSGGRQ